MILNRKEKNIKRSITRLHRVNKKQKQEKFEAQVSELMAKNI